MIWVYRYMYYQWLSSLIDHTRTLTSLMGQPLHMQERKCMVKHHHSSCPLKAYFVAIYCTTVMHKTSVNYLEHTFISGF